MKIVITGGSGFVGQNLVPLLIRPDVQLLLVGRYPERLSEVFPGIKTCSYTDLDIHAKGWDRLVHLAVINTDSTAAAEEFSRVNVGFLIDVAEMAQRAGIKQFVNVSSIHALDPDNHSLYAESKRQAVKRLADLSELDSVTIYLPAVHGDGWGGRLSWLNQLPSGFALRFFELMSAFKPTVDVRRLAEFVMLEKHTQPDRHAGGHDADIAELILSDGLGANKWYAALKRATDITAAIGVILAVWWAMLLIWAVIRVQSPGPGIFAQKRIGTNGREFVCYKFRTMKLGTRQAGTHEITAAAITPFGRFLRATKLDELPQVWNILCNEMSFVGPRPCLPSQTELIEARDRLGVLKAKPGITGLAQINGIDMSDPERLAKWDARYLALRSLGLDISIGLSTLLGRGQGDKVAR